MEIKPVCLNISGLIQQNKLRIISGKYKGRHFSPPPGFRSRPTTDFAKTGLFNILNNYFSFEELEVLDLFSRTGSIALEFISRNARYVEMVEKNAVHFRFIQKVISNLKINNARVFKTDAFVYIPHARMRFDIIFADPPYEMDETKNLPTLIFDHNLLKPDGWLIIEHSAKFDFSDAIQLFDMRKYGSVRFSFFKNM